MTPKGLSALPGLAFPAFTPRFSAPDDFLDYLRRYADTFRVPIDTRTDVATDDQRDLFVGHNDRMQGGLFNIGRDARIVVRYLKAS